MLEDDYRRRMLFGRFHPPEWTDDGLMLGAAASATHAAVATYNELPTAMQSIRQ